MPQKLPGRCRPGGEAYEGSEREVVEEVGEYFPNVGVAVPARKQGRFSESFAGIYFPVLGSFQGVFEREIAGKEAQGLTFEGIRRRSRRLE